MDHIDLGIDPDFFKDENSFNPLHHVVDILEKQIEEEDLSSRLKLDKDLQVVETTLNDKVDNHYAAFGNSVKSFSDIFQEFTEAQSRVMNLKSHIGTCKETMCSRKHHLKELWMKKTQYTRMIDLITQLETLFQAPSRFHDLLEQNQYIKCVDDFQTTHALAHSEAFRDLESLNATRAELVHWKQSITEIVMLRLKDALHSHCSHRQADGNQRAKLLQTARSSQLSATLDGGSLLPPPPHNTLFGESTPEDVRTVRQPELVDESLVAEIVLTIQKLHRLTSALQTVRRELRSDVRGIFDHHIQGATTAQRSLIPTSKQLMLREHLPGTTRQVPGGSRNMAQSQLGFFGEVFADTQTLQRAFALILSDCLQYLANHDILIASLPENDAQISIEEAWAAIQVAVKQFLDLNLRPFAIGGGDLVNRPSSPRKSTVASRLGRTNSMVGQTASDGPEDGFLFLDLDASSWETPATDPAAAVEDGPTVRPPRQINNNGDAPDDRDDSEQVPLAEPSLYNFLVLYQPLVAFLDMSDEIVKHNGRCQLAEYLNEFCVNMLKPAFEQQVLDSLTAVFTVDNICDTSDTPIMPDFLQHNLRSSQSSKVAPFVADIGEAGGETTNMVRRSSTASSPGRRRRGSSSTLRSMRRGSSNNDKTSSSSNNDDNGGAKNSAESFSLLLASCVPVLTTPSSLVSQLAVLIQDVNSYERMMASSAASKFDSVMTNLLNSFVRFCETTIQDQVNGTQVERMVLGQSDYTKMVQEFDPLFGCIFRSWEMHGNGDITMELFHEERVAFAEKEHELFNSPKAISKKARQFRGRGLTTDETAVLSSMVSSLTWLENHLSTFKSELFTGKFRGTLQSICKMQQQCAILLHANVVDMCYLHLGEGQDQTGDTGERSSERFEQKIAALNASLTSFATGLSPMLPQSCVDYVFHTVQFAVTGLVGQQMVQVYPDIAKVKSLLRAAFILEQNLIKRIAAPLPQQSGPTGIAVSRMLNESIEESFRATGVLFNLLATPEQSELASQLAIITGAIPNLDVANLKSVVKRTRGLSVISK